MRALWRRYGLEAVLGLTLVLGLASVANLARSLGQPFGGFFVWRNVNLAAWQLEGSTPPGWPVLAQGQLHYDDTLLALDGHPFDAQAARLYAAAAAQGQRMVYVTIARGGTWLDVGVPLQRFQLYQLFDIKLPDLINGLGFWLLGLAVYRARRQAAVNRAFALGCSLTGGTLWLTIEGLFPEADLPTRALRLAWILLVPFIGAAFAEIITLFPETMGAAYRRWVPALYFTAGGIALVYALSEMLWWAGVQAPWVVGLSAWGLRAVFSIFGGVVLLALARVVWLIGQPRTTLRLRRQLTLILAGLAIALPYVLLIVLRTTFSSAPSYFWRGLDLRYLALAFPLAFAFTILRYQTFQSAQPLLIGMLILASSALLASVGAWLVPLLMPQWRSLVGGTLFPALFIIALSASLFWSTRRAWQGAFNRLFQWEQRSYAAVRQVGQQVVRQIDLARLPETIAQALVDNLKVERAAVWLWDEKDQALHLAGQAGQWPQPPLAALPCAPCALSLPLRLEDEALPAFLEPLRAGRAVEVVAPLWISSELIGWLGLGKRGDEEIFDTRDLEIIELIGQQVALFLFTALQVEQLRQVPDRMARQAAEAQERERFKIAQELHDTTQQFLGRLPFYLELSREAVQTAPAEAEAILARCLTDVESAAQTLRQIRNNLAPRQLEQSLEQPLRALVEQVGRSGLAARLELAPNLDERLAGQPEARHALYRVVQQALDNCLAHAQARHVTVTLTTDAARLALTIVDDGQGSTEEARAQAAARGSFGLTSMRARLTSLGGDFALESAPGQGTTVRGWLPLPPQAA